MAIYFIYITMNNALLLPLLSSFSTLLGLVPIYIKTNRVEEFISFSLSLSLSVMIFISLFDLIPSSVPIILNNYSLIYGVIISILIFILGYFTIYLIENRIKNNNSLYKIGIISFIALILHNLPEGIIVYISTYKNIKLGLKMGLSIMLHNIPEGIEISLPLYYSNVTKNRVVILTFISGFSEFLGALLTHFFLKNYINEIILSFTLLFVSGLMISLSINNIFKELKRYKNTPKYIGVLIGIVISLIIHII